MALTMNLTNVQREAPTFKTATGEIVTLTDAKGEQYFRELQTTIEPVQDLHGYDYPWPAGGGKNKIDLPNLSIPSGVDSTVDMWSPISLSAGTYTLSWTLSATVTATRNRPLYKLNGVNTYANEDSKTAGRASWTFTLSTDSTIQFAWWYHTVSANVTASDFQLESGSTATTYVPYSNECPISGWSEAEVTRTGKNLLLIDATHIAKPIEYGGTWNQVSLVGNGFSTNRRATDGGYGGVWLEVKAGTYVLSYDVDLTNSSGSAGNVYFGNKGVASSAVKLYEFGSNSDTHRTFVITVDNDGILMLRFCAASWTTDTHVVTFSNVQLELGSTATAYEPYNGQTFTIDLGGTRYGGTLDVRRGKLRATKYCYAFTGNETFIHNESAWGAYAYLFNTTVNLVSSIYDSRAMSSHFKRGNYGGCGGLVPNDFIIAGTTYIGLGYNGTANELKAYLSGQVTAGTPVQVIGTLATPIEVDVTPEAITTLLGINNVWANTGEVTVTYKVDPNAEPTLTLASPLRANLGDLRPIVPEAEEIIAESEDPENEANLTTESEVQNGET